MEWAVKDSVWDFGELIGSSSSLEVHKNGGGFSVDLKLGGLGDLGFGSLEKLKETRGSTTSSSPSGSGSSKRSRAAINGAQIMLCLVDGCNADLSKFRDYYRRHRVCERHSKTPLVTIGGKEQRFCQQCSRFQGIGEFDENKRSCRKRLDGHNRRRRKPQPEAFHMSSGSFWSNHQGAKLLCFSGPEAYQSPTTASILTWPKIAKHRQDLHAADQQSIISEPCLYNGGDKRFPFSLVNYPAKQNQALPEVSACHRLVNSSTSPQIGRSHQKTLSDRLTQCINSKRALSLLSSHPTQALDVIHYSDQSIGIGLDNDGLVRYSHSQGVEKSSMLVPQESNETNPHNQLFQVAPDDLLEKRASQVLPFSWK